MSQGALSGAITLSTCNRLELYAELPEDGTRDVALAQQQLAERVAERAGLDERFVLETMDTYHGTEVPQHLFTVVSGLESAVVGEREITGQVRRALNQARQSGTASGHLVQLFEAAARTAREVGARTGLGERGRSIVSVALDLADDITRGSWPDRHALIFGTGAYAGATMAALRDRGCADIEVYSGSGRAQQFTDQRGGSPVTEVELPAALRRADVVIGCSGGSAPMPASAFPSGPRTVIDLALARDFDPAVADLPDVDLITLESVRLAAPEQAEVAVAEARALVDDAVEEYRAAQRGRSADAAIKALRRHTLGVLDRELERVRARHGCTAAAEEVEFALRRMVNQLLHEPSVRAKRLAAEGRLDRYEDALEAVFGIEAPGRPAPAVGTVEAVCPAHEDEGGAARVA